MLTVSEISQRSSQGSRRQSIHQHLLYWCTHRLERIGKTVLLILPTWLTLSRTSLSTLLRTMPYPPRSVVMFRQASARKLALPGKIMFRSGHQIRLTMSDSSPVRLPSVSSENTTASSARRQASSSVSASPTPKLKSNSSSRVRNAEIGAAASTATRSSTLHRRP